MNNNIANKSHSNIIPLIPKPKNPNISKELEEMSNYLAKRIREIQIGVVFADNIYPEPELSPRKKHLINKLLELLRDTASGNN